MVPKSNGRTHRSERIDLDAPDEMRHWMEWLGVSREKLRADIRVAGRRAKKLRQMMRRLH